MPIEKWNPDQVTKWLANIGLAQFSSVLNVNIPFTGIELLTVTTETLVKFYHLDKKVAKKIIRERNRAMAYLHLDPKDFIAVKKANGDVSHPFGARHSLHVEYVHGHGFKGLPDEWQQSLREDGLQNSFIQIPARKPVQKAKSMPEFDYSKTDDVNTWKPSQIAEWLKSIGLPIFIPEFKDAGIDGLMLMTLPYSELFEYLNIEIDQLAQKLLKHIETLREANEDNLQSRKSKLVRRENPHDHQNILIPTKPKSILRESV